MRRAILLTLTTCSLGLLGASAPPAAPPVAPGPAAPPPPSGADAVPAEANVRDLVRDARAALEREDYGQAVSALEALERVRPEDPAVPFNMGVAKYCKGDFAGAAEAFERAGALTDDETLRGTCMYNQGNAAYRAAAQDQSQIPKAKEGLERSLDRYKDALRANPGDEDARANAEYVTRRLRQLEQMQQPQQQAGEQDEMDDQDDPEQNRQQQQQGDERRQRQQGGDDEVQQGQGQDQDQTQNDGSDEQQRREEQHEGQREGEEQQQAEGEQQDYSEEQQENPQGAGNDRTEERRMTPEEARRLLQMVRDKERQRRRQLAERSARQQRPVVKDW